MFFKSLLINVGENAHRIDIVFDRYIFTILDKTLTTLFLIFLARYYYIEQTSPIRPPINVVFISYRFNIVWGRGGKLRGLFDVFSLGTHMSSNMGCVGNFR